MSRNRRLWIAGLALGMSACTTFRPHPDTAKACAAWRWIGISTSEAQCPEISGWTVRPLFPQLAPARRPSEDYCRTEKGKRGDYCEEIKVERVPSRELIRELNRFCVYEPKQPKKFFAKPPFPPAASAGLVRFDQDCAAVSFADTELDSKKWKSDYKDFLTEAGRIPLRVDHGPRVRLAFLDTQPTREGFPPTAGNSPHGYTLANIARNLLCTADSPDHCAAQITTRLALPVINFSPRSPRHNEVDTERGGFLGMQSDLAAAIRNEVDTWRKHRERGNSPQHLVLSLSLAWDGKLFGGLTEEWVTEMRAGTQAVYRALQYATSFDVLVLAAAGNQKCRPCENTGPLLPAAWEQDTPQEQGCPTETRKNPLVYAVGGLDSDGSPLANARPGGMPRRAAYGETPVVTRVDLGTLETTYNGMLYSGSSVATAVVSSIAAFVWNAFPHLDSHRLMEILDSSGDPRPFEADFRFVDANNRTYANAPTVRRLSLCRTLSTACVVPYLCPIQLHCGGWEPRRSFRRDVATFSQGSCEPWLYPQPEDPPCLACIQPPP